MASREQVVGRKLLETHIWILKGIIFAQDEWSLTVARNAKVGIERRWHSKAESTSASQLQ